MAKKLNKNRIRDTSVLVGLSFIAILFSKQIFDHNEPEKHELFEFTGYFLIAIAAMGRVYCTAFLGGFKNHNIIDYGPFSISRNPLYLFSFIGVCGFALMSVNLIAIIIMPAGFLAIYIPLIKREEIYLEGKFGKAYLTYKKKTPRLFPNFRRYHSPAEVAMTPRTLNNALKDSIMWFLAFPALEFIEWVQDEGYLQPFFYANLF